MTLQELLLMERVFYDYVSLIGELHRDKQINDEDASNYIKRASKVTEIVRRDIKLKQLDPRKEE